MQVQQSSIPSVFHLPQHQKLILLALYNNELQPPQLVQIIADHTYLHLTLSGINPILRSLEGRGLIRSRATESGVKAWRITDEGKRLVAEGVKAELGLMGRVGL